MLHSSSINSKNDAHAVASSPSPPPLSQPLTYSQPHSSSATNGDNMLSGDSTISIPTHDQKNHTDNAVRRRHVLFKDQSTPEERNINAAPELSLKDEKFQPAVELSHIDQDDNNKLSSFKGENIENGDENKNASGKDEMEKSNSDHTSTQMDHALGQRVDRHLFPYRTVKENMHAINTFFRRFFLITLIVPAWTIPIVLTARAKHEMELSHGNADGNNTISHAALEFGGLKYVMLSKAGADHGAGAAHGPELSLAANWVIFGLNLLVMMHLGKAAGAALEELVPKFGARVVSVLDALTSSSIELAVAAIALKKGLVVVVQAAMLGAILNNLLLMLGISILVGGIHNKHQKLKKETTQTSVHILMLTCIAYVIPIGLDVTLTSVYRDMRPVLSDPVQRHIQTQEIRTLVDIRILTLSKIMAIILLALYGICLYYQLLHRTFMITPEAKHEGAHTVETRHTHFWFAGFAFVVVMAAQIYSANFLVHAVESLGRQLHLNDSFVGFILLPIVLIADLQEEVIAIKEARANRMDKAVSLMVGSCMQIALLVTPILVLLGWIMDVPMTFRFTILEVVILSGSILLINYLISDHETNWFEGIALLAVFVICAIAFFYDNPHLHIIPSEDTTLNGEGVGAGGALVEHN